MWSRSPWTWDSRKITTYRVQNFGARQCQYGANFMYCAWIYHICHILLRMLRSYSRKPLYGRHRMYNMHKYFINTFFEFNLRWSPFFQYAILMFIIIILQVVIAVLIFVYINDVEKVIREILTKAFEDRTPVAVEAFNSLQTAVIFTKHTCKSNFSFQIPSLEMIFFHSYIVVV